MAHGLTGSSQVDVAILTVIPAELIAVRKALGIPEDARFEDEKGTIGYRGRLHSALARRDYEVVLTCMGRAGNDASATMAQTVISRYHPQAVLLVGIAAGVRGKLRIGDVVLSERVVAYESAAFVSTREGGSREEPRPEIRPIPHRMSQAVANYQPDEERLRKRFEQGGAIPPPPPPGSKRLYQEHVAAWPQVRPATIASGDKLFRDSARMAELRSLHGKIEAVEMEAAGLMVSCEENGIPWLVIRGISDFGDELKNDGFHAFASRAAAAVLADFLQHGLKLKGRRRRRWMGLAAGVLLLAAVGGLASMVPHGSELPAWICGSELTLKLFKSSVFKQPDATRFLVARFEGDTSSEADVSERVSTHVAHALRVYKEETLRDPREMDIEVPEDSLEIKKVACVIGSHKQAETLARILDANVVIWGRTSSNPGENHYTVHPSATLYETGRSIHRGGEDRMELANLGRLDLPAFRLTEPFLLVQFALGLHFYEQGKHWLAARFFQKSADLVLPKERGMAELHLVLGRAYHHLPDLTRSLRHSRLALEAVRGSGSELEGTLIGDIGATLHLKGDYTEALEHLQRALAMSEKRLGPDHPEVALRLNNVGFALAFQGDYAKALAHCRRALVIAERVLGPEHLLVASILGSMGTALAAQGDYAEALKHFQRELEMEERILGPEHPIVAISRSDMGTVLFCQGDYAGALHYFHSALAITEKVLGLEHPLVAKSLTGMGAVLQAQGDGAEALRSFRRALEVREKSLGPEHVAVAESLDGIGTVLNDRGDYAEALKYFQRERVIAEKAVGPEHPIMARSLSNMGFVLHSQGNYVGALELLRRALEVREKVWGPEHPDVADSLDDICMVLNALGDSEGALAQCRRARAITEKALGPKHPRLASILSNMGRAFQAQRDYMRALEHLLPALAIAETAWGPEHPKVFITLNSVGIALKGQGDYAGALKHYRRAQAITEKAFGPEHPDVAVALNNIGMVLAVQGDPARALDHYWRALAITEKALGSEHPDVATVLTNIGGALADQGEHARALALYQRALAMTEKALGPEHPQVATTLANMGTVLEAQGERARALALYQRALASMETVLGKEHPVTQALRSRLGSMLPRQEAPPRPPQGLSGPPSTSSSP